MGDSKKKILYVITKSNWGGAQKYVFDLATQIDKNSFEVVIALGGDGELKTRLQESGKRVLSIKGLKRNISLTSDFLSCLDLHDIIKKEKPDILHINSSKIGLIGSLLGRLNQVPRIIFTAHGWAFNEKRPLYQKLLIKFLHWLTLLLSHQTITVSKSLQQQMQHFPFIKRKMTTIYNGIDEIIPFLEKDEARKKLNEKNPELKITNETFLIGTIGELHSNKGQDYLIEAIYKTLKNNPNIKGVIIGEGERRISLQDKIKKNKLENHLFLLGKIENASFYLKAFDLFILPSITEALPYVILESSKAGVPIITSEVGGIPEIITNKQLGTLVLPRDTTQLAEAIETNIHNYDQAVLSATRLKERVDHEFSIKQMIKKTKILYLATAGHHF